MDLVIALYKERIDWIYEIKDLNVNRIFIYLKDASRYDEIRSALPDATIKVLENVGRESHTYLHHIKTHYNELGDRILFLQGYPFDHCVVYSISELLKNPTDSFSALGTPLRCDSTGDPHHPDLPVAHLYMKYFQKYQIVFQFVAGAQFMVTRDRIQSIPLEIYEKLYDAHYTEPLLPWCMERYWLHMYQSRRRA